MEGDEEAEGRTVMTRKAEGRGGVVDVADAAECWEARRCDGEEASEGGHVGDGRRAAAAAVAAEMWAEW